MKSLKTKVLERKPKTCRPPFIEAIKAVFKKPGSVVKSRLSKTKTEGRDAEEHVSDPEAGEEADRADEAELVDESALRIRARLGGERHVLQRESLCNAWRARFGVSRRYISAVPPPPRAANTAYDDKAYSLQRASWIKCNVQAC